MQPLSSSSIKSKFMIDINGQVTFVKYIYIYNFKIGSEEELLIPKLDY